MKVYHGTSFDRFTEITMNGLAPRGDTPTNWPDNPSMSDMVYLTTAYPFYFAECTSAEDGSKPVVIEINMDHLLWKNLYPDEDFILQAMKEEDRWDLKDIRNNIDQFRKYYQKSMDHLGNFCYRGVIPRQAMTRAVTVDYKNRGHLLMEVMDPTISIINYQIVGQKYKDLVAWFFGDKEELPGVQRSIEYMDHAPETAKPQMLKAAEFWKKESKNRKGIGIISL